jgi:uncharacterized protein (TIGR02453 family)
MLKSTTISFMREIAINNNKPWFDEHKAEYLAAKADFEELVAEVLIVMGNMDPVYKDISAKECVMRIFRDVRFSKDKTPYKTNFGAGFSSGGKNFPGAGYYLHIQPGGNSFGGGGMWQPESAQLKAIRQEIDYNFEEFSKIVNDSQFKNFFGQIEGDKLVKVPKGYTEDNKAIEYLRLKSFTVGSNITDAALSQKGLVKKITDAFIAMKPFVDFLNRAVV